MSFDLKIARLVIQQPVDRAVKQWCHKGEAASAIPAQVCSQFLGGSEHAFATVAQQSVAPELPTTTPVGKLCWSGAHVISNPQKSCVKTHPTLCNVITQRNYPTI